MWTVSGFLLLHEEPREPSKKPWNKEAQIPKWNPGLCYGDAAPAVSPVSATRQHNEWRFLLNHLAWAFLLCLLQTCLHATQLGVPELRCNSSGFSAEMLQRWCSFKLLYIKNTFFFFFYRYSQAEWSCNIPNKCSGRGCDGISVVCLLLQVRVWTQAWVVSLLCTSLLACPALSWRQSSSTTEPFPPSGTQRASGRWTSRPPTARWRGCWDKEVVNKPQYPCSLTVGGKGGGGIESL